MQHAQKELGKKPKFQAQSLPQSSMPAQIALASSEDVGAAATGQRPAVPEQATASSEDEWADTLPTPVLPEDVELVSQPAADLRGRMQAAEPATDMPAAAQAGYKLARSEGAGAFVTLEAHTGDIAEPASESQGGDFEYTLAEPQPEAKISDQPQRANEPEAFEATFASGEGPQQEAGVIPESSQLAADPPMADGQLEELNAAMSAASLSTDGTSQVGERSNNTWMQIHITGSCAGLTFRY